MGAGEGAPIAAKRVVMRVSGSPIYWELPGDGWKHIKAELPTVCGDEAGEVRVVKSSHLPESGLQ